MDNVDDNAFNYFMSKPDYLACKKDLKRMSQYNLQPSIQTDKKTNDAYYNNTVKN